MPEKHVAFITKCVVEGLDFLRQCDIQHRDVKPTNMLVNRSGCVKVSGTNVYFHNCHMCECITSLRH